MKTFSTLLFAFTILAFGQEKPSIHQQEWQYYKAHPEKIGTTVVPPSFAKKQDLMNVQSLKKVVYGFHPYWQNGSENNYYFSLLTHLAYFSGDVDPSTGNFSSTHSWSSASVVTLAKQYGVKVHFTVTFFSDHATLFNNNAARTNLINNIIAQINVRNADGCNLDFEGVPVAVKDSMRTFIVQLGTALHAAGKELVVELPAVDWSSGWSVWGTTFFQSTVPYVDYYFLMAYDYWWSGSSTAGPVAPLQSASVTTSWHSLRSINTYLSKGCPANKLIAGFPYYGYDWPTTGTGLLSPTTATGSSRTYTVVKNNYIDTIPQAHQYWNSSYNTRWYYYNNGSTWRECWYDDSLSLALKYNTVLSKDIAGTGMWALGYDGNELELWQALKSAFASSSSANNTVLDDFENGVGHFDKTPTFSGTTKGISNLSSVAFTNDIAGSGWGSLQVILKDDAGVTTDWTVRLLSGGGSAASNTAFPTTGYFGFWLKTTSAPANAQVALSIDGGSGGTLISEKLSIINDDKWNLYQWNLDSTTWSILAGTDSLLNGPTATLDALMFYAPNGSPDWKFYIDNVSHNSSGTLPVRQLTSLPLQFSLEQNYPNPFNPTTTISFSIPHSAMVKLAVFDYLGREVETLVDEYKNEGKYNVVFDAKNLSSGVYFYRLQAGTVMTVKRMLLLK